MHNPIDCNVVATHLVCKGVARKEHAPKRARPNDVLDGGKDASMRICHMRRCMMSFLLQQQTAMHCIYLARQSRCRGIYLSKSSVAPAVIPGFSKVLRVV